MTLTLPTEAWIMAALAVLVGAKFIQQGGVLFGRGERWEWITLPGALMHVAVIVGGGAVLLLQNAS